ncbi:hypothetical protein FPOAC2_07523 [Fusarium poae]
MVPTAQRPGILFDPYKGATKYEIPGPAMYSSGSTKPIIPSVPSNNTLPTSTPAPTPVAPTSLVTSIATPTAQASSVATKPAGCGAKKARRHARHF